jgi:hypothetical protein
VALSHVYFHHPRQFFLLPVGKVMFRIFFMFLYLVLFCRILANRIYIDSERSVEEFVIYVIALGFLASSVATFFRTQLAKRYNFDDTEDGYSKGIQRVLQLSLFITFILRFGNMPDFENQMLTYYVLMSINTILMFLQIVPFFMLSKTLGPLQKVLMSTLSDILRWSSIMLIFWLAQSLCFWYLVQVSGESVQGYNNFKSTLVSTFSGFVGGFSLAPFPVVQNPYVSKLLLILSAAFAILSGIVVINILIGKWFLFTEQRCIDLMLFSNDE